MKSKQVYWFVLMALLIARSALSQVPKSYQNGSITLYYEEQGSGPPLYILSGGPGEAPDHPYRQIIDSLKTFYTCVLLHQRGAGLSRNIPVNAETIAIKNYVEDIHLLQLLRKDKQIALLGYSWGGLLAQAFAAQYPKLVSQLFLLASAPPSYTVWNVLFDNQFARRSQAELDSMVMLQQIFSIHTDRELDSLKRVNPTNETVQAYKAFMALHVRAMYYDKRKISKSNFESLFASFNFQPIPYIDQEVLGTKWDITAALKKLKTPALIIYGRQDDQGESTFFLQQTSLKNSEVHVIEQCGHEMIEEQPVEFFRILMNYVRRQGSENQ